MTSLLSKMQATIRSRDYLYLTPSQTYVQIGDSSWDEYYDVGCMKKLYLQKSSLIQGDRSTFTSVPFTARDIYVFKPQTNEEGPFATFYQAWLKNQATWGRGITLSHDSYPTLQGGRLEGEGQTDKPYYSGDDLGVKTVWLPGDAIPFRNYSRNQSQKIYSTEVLFTQMCVTNVEEQFKDQYILAGIVVGTNVGIGVDLEVAWMDTQEVQVKGPLDWSKLAIHFVGWYRNGSPNCSPCTPSLVKSLPPYRKSRGADKSLLEQWWKDCQPWVQTALNENLFTNIAQVDR